MNKLIKAVNTIIKQNPKTPINLFILNNGINDCTKCSKITTNIQKPQISEIKFTATEEMEIRYLERKSLEFAIKN